MIKMRSVFLFGAVLVTLVSCKKQKYDYLCTTTTFKVVDAKTYSFVKEDTITLKQVDQIEATKYQNENTDRSVSPGSDTKLTSCHVKF